MTSTLPGRYGPAVEVVVVGLQVPEAAVEAAGDGEVRGPGEPRVPLADLVRVVCVADGSRRSERGARGERMPMAVAERG